MQLGTATIRSLFLKDRWKAYLNGTKMTPAQLDSHLTPDGAVLSVGDAIYVFEVPENGKHERPVLDEHPLKSLPLTKTWLIGPRAATHEANPMVHEEAHVPGVLLLPGGCVVIQAAESYSCNNPVGRFQKKHFAQWIEGHPSLAIRGLLVQVASKPAPTVTEPLLAIANFGPLRVLLRPSDPLALVRFVHEEGDKIS